MEKITGKIARVNLTSGYVKITDSEEYFRWMGGRGFGDWIIMNEVKKETHPISEHNKMVFATGCFTGTSLPGSSRIELVTKNLLNNGISYSSGGGNFGPELKRAGLDAVIIEGKSSFPVYLFINNGKVELKDASGLWGKTTWDTEDAIRKELKDDSVKVACIGPAGENLVKISCIVIDKAHVLAWGGSGAIMGSKNLKAIAVKGIRNIKIFDPQRYNNETSRYKWILLSSSASSALREGGTHGMAGVGGWSGKVPTSVRNLQEEYWEPEKSRRISEETFRQYEKRRTHCFNCPLYCLHWYEMEHNGEYLACEGMHANSVRGFGSNWDVDDPFAVLKAHALCNKLGLDVDGVSSTVAWAIECFERGIINTDDTSGLMLKWGNAGDLLKLIENIAYKKGFGEILAEGVYRASGIVGKNSHEYAMHVKGVGINEQGVRSHKAWSFGIAVSTRGSGHLSGSPQTENRQIPRHVGKWLFGCEEAGVPTSYKNKAKLVAWYEIYKALVDSAGICYFNAGWYDVALADIENLVVLYNALTGASITKKELWNIGRRIVNIEKAFNTVHAGFTREHDILPRRIMEEPLTSGPFKGQYMERDKFQLMLDEYYGEHGWDPKTGLQKAETLIEIEAGEILNFLTQHKILA